MERSMTLKELMQIVAECEKRQDFLRRMGIVEERTSDEELDRAIENMPEHEKEFLALPDDED